ncbi:bardet-Biedl syndrome 10 protein [Trichonephila clavata]|uniref:Bardet-Biedl syndrome 10 protein n=1 Tax=Trichonephila clavata TaxID=2740835 RepID=A0A8X6J3T6_TRICU|nr:bardet-Biedl syndrome 10 protein [Trichonephila clavata]
MQNVSLKQIIACCDGLGSFVEEVLDPHSMTLVVEEMVFTQQTSRILSAVEWKHPMEKIILETISLYRNQTGDDCKMFLLLLKEFMNSIGDKLETSDEAQLRKTISKEITCLMSLLPSIFKNVRNIFARLSFIQFLSFSEDLEGLVSTFFHARFSPNVSLKLTQLICSFLSLTISNSNHAVESLSYLILNFDVFCSKVILPLSQSTVIEGFALLHQLPSNHESKDIFVIVQELPQNSHEGFYYNINSESFPLHFRDSLESSLKCLKFKKVSVILTSSRASDNFASLCSQYKILIIDSITKEDIDNILYFVGISPLVTLKDPLLPQNLGCMEALKSIVMGDTCFAHLKIQVSSKSIAPNHIILCAPVENAWKDYYSECHNCLKVVRQWLHFHFINLKHSEMTEEKCLKIQDMFKNSSGLFLDILKSTIPHEECISESAFGVAFPVGLFEFSLKMALADLQKNKLSTIKTLYDILESALLRVICKLWNISIQKLEPGKGYLKFYERIRSRISIPIEPASNKEHLVYMILQLVQQLMKIDAILYTKSRI